MKSKLFCCFSIPLRDFLTIHNVRYEICALNEKSKKTMWVYMRTQKLNELLTEWSTKKIS